MFGTIEKGLLLLYSEKIKWIRVAGNEPKSRMINLSQFFIFIYFLATFIKKIVPHLLFYV